MAGNLRNEVAIPLDVRCNCPRPRRIPVSLDVEFWIIMRNAVAAVELSKGHRVFNVHCRHCNSSHPVSIGDLRLSPATSPKAGKNGVGDTDGH